MRLISPLKACGLLGVLAYITIPGLAATYEVGPGKSLSTIGSVPWATLMPGDTILIHARPAPYKEKWVICRQGTASQPITVRGVPDASGNLPVIDGNGAVEAPGLNYWNSQRAVIKIGGANIPSDTMPKYIVLDSLDIANASLPFTYTDSGGSQRSYLKNASSIYVEKGENITIRNCKIHGSGNGLFVASSDGEPSRSLLVDGNYIYGNGNSGSIFEHNSYTAAVGITFQNNWYGPLKAGSGGNALKDRSSGLVVRYNWIDGANRQLDLVDAEDSVVIRNDPNYRQTFVYGNVLVEPSNFGNSQILHYGGDSGAEANYRKGTLYFYNNTVVSGRTSNTTLARLSSAGERMDARNNIVYTYGGGGLSLLDAAGTIDLSRNWLKSGWVNTFSGSPASVNNNGGNITGTSPGFANESAQDFRLGPGSPASDIGGLIAPAGLPQNDLVSQYLKHQRVEVRPRLDLIDAGAFESASIQPPLPDTQVPSVSISAPTAAATIAGVVMVAGLAVDNIGVTRVELLVNGQLNSSGVLPAFSFPLDTKTLANGPANVTVRAYDAASNLGQFSISFTVANPGVSTGPSTQVFSYGLNGYTGANDLVMSNYRGGNGATYRNGRNHVDRNSSGVEYRMLLKFGDMSVPIGHQVTSATMKLAVNTYTRGIVLDGYYLSSAWTDSSTFGWLIRMGALPWLSAGASESDRVPSKTFTMSGFSPTGEQSVTAILDPAMVQQWISNPSTNQGIQITNRSINAGMFVYSWRSTDPLLRPVLTIVSAPTGAAATAALAPPAIRLW